MDKIIDKAYAKINLMLRVLNRREDGYHNLQMVNIKIDLFDLIEITKTTKDVIVEFNPVIEVNNNIVKKTAIYMMRKFNIDGGLKIKIKKHIPIGAGLGGGSSDVAVVINLIDSLFNLQLKNKEKEEIALLFGADVPYCLYNKMAIVEGIGEKVTLIANPLPYNVIVVYPNIVIKTKDIFLRINNYSNKIDEKALIEAINKGQAFNFFINDLTKEVVKEYPLIKEIIERISKDKVEHVMMSGSGSAIFALVIDEFVDEVYEKIRNEFPNYYVGLHQIID